TNEGDAAFGGFFEAEATVLGLATSRLVDEDDDVAGVSPESFGLDWIIESKPLVTRRGRRPKGNTGGPDRHRLVDKASADRPGRALRIAAHVHNEGRRVFDGVEGGVNLPS